jgi:hypothetical protein
VVAMLQYGLLDCAGVIILSDGRARGIFFSYQVEWMGSFV